jgi:predicted PurR-regulated permease PerM
MNLPNLRYRIPVIASLAGLLLIVAFWMLRKALAPFFLAMVMAYLLAPLVERLARRMKRGWAVVLVGLGSLGSLALLLWVLLPRLFEQLGRLIASIPVWKQALEARWTPWLEAHPWIQGKVTQGLDGLDPTFLLKGAWGAGVDLLGWFLQGMTLLLVPVIVYYLLLEGPSFLETLDGMAPPRHRDRIREVAANIHQRLGGFIRGQIAVSTVMAIAQSLAFMAVGVPYAWLLGLVAGISNVVPYSPYLTALAPALLIAGLGGAGGGHLLLIALVFTAVQKLEALYLTPVWVGRASRLHPLEVLLGILCFGFAFGLVGLIFAVPLMIVVKVILETLIADYKQHPWFQEGTGEPAPGIPPQAGE